MKNKTYQAIYFYKSRELAKQTRPKSKIVTMHWFQRSDDVTFSGIGLVIRLIKKRCENWRNLEIWSLDEGEVVNNEEPVMIIKGYYEDFCFLEGEIDGIFGMQCTVATNARSIIKAAEGVPVIYMNDRNGYVETQKYDGYAAYIGGIRYFTSYEQTKLLPAKDKSIKVIGSIPHSLIQLYKGDLSLALKDYKTVFPNDKLIGLVDYKNEVVAESIRVAKDNPELFAVRIDTAANLVDASLVGSGIDIAELRGVNRHLVKKLRKKLDEHGFNRVKIIISSGLNAEKISNFQKWKTPVDYYGVGLAFVRNYINFTGDSVALNGKHQAKVGRKLQNITNLKKIKWDLNND